MLLRGLHFAIVDEADSVLIDEARIPLIISSELAGFHDHSVYQHALGVAQGFVQKEDYTVSLGEKSVDLTDQGRSRIRDVAWQDAGIQINEKQQ